MAFTRRMRQASAGRLGSISQLVTPSFTSITVASDSATHTFTTVPVPRCTALKQRW